VLPSLPGASRPNWVPTQPALDDLPVRVSGQVGKHNLAELRSIKTGTSVTTEGRPGVAEVAPVEDSETVPGEC